jgi:hypothetical protein
MTTTLEDLWPPFGLTIAVGPVTLSPVRDEDLTELAALVMDGIHAPTDMPFTFPWTQGSVEVVRLRILQYQWAQRAAMSPNVWTLENTVRFEGEIVGCQSISTKDYLVTRTGETGSWLGSIRGQSTVVGGLRKSWLSAQRR